MTRFTAGAILGVLLGMVVGLTFARATIATPPSSPTPVSGWTTLGAPQPLPAVSPTVGSAGASADAESSGVPSLQPAAEQDSPSPTVGASVPATPTPVSGTFPASGYSLRGVASWFCLPGRSTCTAGYPAPLLVAAAGPRLRSALGPGWRGRTVLVTAGERSVHITLRDWCQCHAGTSRERIVDLYGSVVRALGLSLSRGVYSVRASW